MKRTELFFSALLVPLDFCLLMLAAWLAYWLRFETVVTDLRPVLYDISPLIYLRSVVLVSFTWLLVFAVYGLYHRRATDPWWPEVGRVLLACSTGLVVVIVAIFFRREFFSSRFILLAGAALAVVFVSLGRLAIRVCQWALFRYGVGAHRVVVIGQGHVAEEIVARMRQHPEYGYVVAVELPASGEALPELARLVAGDLIDELLFVEPNATSDVRQQFLEFAEDHHVNFRYAPDLLRGSVGRVALQLELGVPLVAVPETTIAGWGRIIKRAGDILCSLISLIVLSPLLAIIALLVRLDSHGPALYRNRRIGRGQPFTLYKFRSMKIEYCTGEEYGGTQAAAYEQELLAAKNIRRGPVPKIADDPRWTGVGKWLRRFSLDELPQLYNVLVGDMSLVGPRPHLPQEVSNYQRHHRKVLAVKPGLTGLAQVSGRSDLDFEDEVRFDRYYLEHWTPWLDASIILRTVVAVLQSRRTL